MSNAEVSTIQQVADQTPLAPMEAVLVEALPDGPGWQYEPKWDGFRAIVMRDGDTVEIWSKSGKPLGRYFPEIVTRIKRLREQRLVLDGELVVSIGGQLSFDALQARLHPAASRVARLSKETPAQLILFDLIRLEGADLCGSPLRDRRAALERYCKTIRDNIIVLSPAALDKEQATLWLDASGGALDGVVAKPLGEAYRPGERAMFKVKQMRTAECVVGGYRKTATGDVASLLLGFYNDTGELDLVGFSSGFTASQRATLSSLLKPHEGGAGFTGKAPSGPSRWSPNKSRDYIALRHDLVAEVIYDQVTAGRFRHGTKFLRWRADKAPRQCTHDQLVRSLRPAELLQLVE